MRFKLQIHMKLMQVDDAIAPRNLTTYLEGDFSKTSRRVLSARNRSAYFCLAGWRLNGKLRLVL